MWCTQVEFPPDLCSRVTFVNFTVTRSSLQSQCLNQVLKAERPDVDAKRSDLLKLQGHNPLHDHWNLIRTLVVFGYGGIVCVSPVVSFLFFPSRLLFAQSL